MEQYIAIHTYDFIDPLKIKDKIQALQDKISAFEAEVDATPSVSNALTEIEVCY